MNLFSIPKMLCLAFIIPLSSCKLLEPKPDPYADCAVIGQVGSRQNLYPTVGENGEIEVKSYTVPSQTIYDCGNTEE